MTHALAPVAALLLSAAILLMGNGLQGTLLPVRAHLEAFSTFDIGLLGSSYFLGFAAGCILGPYVVRRVGHIRAFTAIVSITSTTALLHVLIVDSIAWLPLRALTGFCFATLYMIIESWLNEKATNQTRGLVFSVYTAINLSVMTAGQMMLTLDDPAQFGLFALASVLVSLAAVPVALTRADAPPAPSTVRIRLNHLYRLSPVGFVGALVVGLVNGSFWSLGPVFAQRNDLNTTGIAVFMSVTVIAGAITQYPLGRFSDRWDRRKMIITASAGAASAGLGMVALFGLLPGGFLVGVLVFGALFGAFALPLYSICAAHMNDYVESGGFVEAASGLLLLYGLGAAVGPLMASAAMRYGGTNALFGYTALVHVGLVGFTVYRMSRRASLSEAERMSFTESVLVTQTVAPMDPLAHEHEDQPRAAP